jgi:hypothetical protein
VFENLSSLSVSGSGRAAGFRLESLEDRTTPAIVSTLASPFGSFTFDTNVLNAVALTASASTDRAFLAEVARVSVMEWFLGTTVANQGSNQQIRSFGQQLADSQLALFNQLVPVLNRSGIALQLTALDQALVSGLPTLSGTALDTQFLFFSSLYGLQAAGFAQTESLFGTDPNVRSFAQSLLSPFQNQLQTGFGFLGTNAANTTLNMFASLGGFGSLGVTGLGTTGFGTNPFGTGFGTTGFGTTGINTNTTGSFANGQTFGTFGTSAFGPGATSGATVGFGPGAPFGTPSSGPVIF